MKPLTPKHQALYDYITAYREREQRTPTRKEMATAMGVKQSAIQCRLRVLTIAGYLRSYKSKAVA